MMLDKLRERVALALMPTKADVRYIGIQTPNVPVYSDLTVSRATREGYKISVYVYRAVRTIIQAASAIPWIVLDKNGEPVDGHPLIAVFQKPNPEFSGQDLFEFLIAHLELVGNALWQPIIVGREIREIWPVMPDIVKPIPGERSVEWLKGWEVTLPSGGQQILPPETFIHFQQVNPGNPYWGIGPLLAAARTIDTDNEAQDTQKVSMQNRGVTDGAFIHESPLSQEQFEEARRQIKENFLQRSRRREPWVLGSGTKWQQMSMTTVEMDYIASRLQNKRDIAAAFGISPIFLGDLEQSSYNNMLEARKSLYEDVTIPLLDDIKATLNLKVAPLYGDIEVAYDVSNVDVLRGDFGKKVEQAKNLWAMGVPFNQINEKLELGFEEFSGWEQGYLPFNVAPVTEGKSLWDETYNAAIGGLIKSGKQDWSEEQKAIYWKRIDTRRAGWWNVVDKKLLPLYESEGKAVDKIIKNQTGDMLVAAVGKAIDSQRDGWEKVLTAIGVNLVEDFGNDTAQDLGAAKWRFDPFTPGSRQWLASHTAMSIRSILETNLLDVKQIITRGFEENLSTPQVAKGLRQFYINQSPYKAMRVARTEVAAVSSFGQIEAARQSKVVDKKRWLSSRDDRVRDSHMRLDGESVELDGKFSNGCEAPGICNDVSEAVNCRCVLQFVK